MSVRGLIVLTGGAGYLGSVAARTLLVAGYHVRVIDAGWFGYGGLEAVRDRITLLREDIRSAQPAWFADAVGVVHLAGLSTDPMADFDPAASQAINADATAHLAHCAREAGVRRFIYGSTGAVYDRGLAEHDALQREDESVAPQAAYPASKYSGERALAALRTNTFLPIILRQGTVYGWSPRMRYDLAVNAFVRDAMTTGTITVHAGGEQWRPMIHIADMADAYVHYLSADALPVTTIINVFSRNYRVLEIAMRVRDVLRDHGVQCDIRMDYTSAGRRQRSYRCDGGAMAATGFGPNRTLEEAVLELVQHFSRQSLAEWYDPRGENMRWLRLVREMRGIAGAVY